MPNFAVKNADLLDTVNYLLAGNTGIGQQVQVYSGRKIAYLTGNTQPPYQIQSDENPIAYLSILSSQSVAGVTTLTFATQPAAPYTVGQSIYVEVVNPFSNPPSLYSWSGTWTVSACTTSTVSYVSGLTSALNTSPGHVQSGYPSLVNFSGQTLLSNAYVDVSITGADDLIILNSQAKWGAEYVCSDTPSTNRFTISTSLQRTDLPRQNSLIELVQDNNQFPDAVNPFSTLPTMITPEETVFIGITDTPGIGVWRYWLTYRWTLQSGSINDVYVNWIYIRNNTLNATVIKK